MFNTLFSRMLATYLSVMLAILLLLGITVAGMFQNQYIAEQESELRREAEEVTFTIVTKYLDDDKRPVATEELVTTARKYCLLYTSAARFCGSNIWQRMHVRQSIHKMAACCGKILEQRSGGDHPERQHAHRRQYFFRVDRDSNHVYRLPDHDRSGRCSWSDVFPYGYEPHQ